MEKKLYEKETILKNDYMGKGLHRKWLYKKKII